MPPVLTVMTCYIFLITLVLEESSMSLPPVPSNDTVLFGQVPIMACSVPVTCPSTLLIERSDMDSRNRDALLSRHPRSEEAQGCLCGPSGLCTPGLREIPPASVL